MQLVKLDPVTDKANVTKRLKVLENNPTRVIVVFATRVIIITNANC